MLDLVDVHVDYQAGLNIETLARQGYAACVVKATQGSTGYTAPAAFNDWINRTRAAGMVAGAYHWLTNSNPVNQAHHFLSRLDQVGGARGLLLQIDCEDTTSPAAPDTIAGFVAEMNRNTGGHPLAFYTGAWWYGPHLGGWRVADLGVRSWHSHYVTATHGTKETLRQFVPATWWTPGYGGFARATFLQYTSRGDAGGLTANVDLNLFDGTIDQLHALARGGTDMYEQFDRDLLQFTKGTVAGISGQVAALGAILAKVAEQVNIDAAELAAIQQAAAAGTAAALDAAAGSLAAEIVTALRESAVDVDGETVEAAVRKVFRDAGEAPQG